MIRIVSLKKSKFVKSVIALAGGTAFGQIISVLLSPIITRIYSPEALGVLGVFTSFNLIISAVVTLEYNYAIAVASDNGEAYVLLKASNWLSVIIGSILFFVVVLFSSDIATLIGFNASPVLLLCAVPMVIFTGLKQTLNIWMIRFRRFKTIGVILAVNAFLIGAMKILLGLWYPRASFLIYATLAGVIILVALMLYYNIDTIKENKQKETEYLLIPTLRKYYRFPLYRAPQVLFQNISTNFPIIVLSFFYGPAIAGFFALSKRVLVLPSSLISRSVGKVLLPNFAEKYNEGVNLQNTLIKSTLSLALVGIIPYGLVMLTGKWLFSLVFGSQWEIAGLYAQWMSLLMFFNFIVVPSIQSLTVLEKQKQTLLWEVISTIVKIAAIVLTGILIEKPLFTIALYAVISAASYLIIIIYAFKNSYNVSK